MEEKLYLRNRGDGDYFLESRTSNSASVVGSLNPTHFAEHKLSLKNCQAIELGYDLDELAMGYDLYENINFVGQTRAYKAGFQKALEILGDKKFSERDVKIAYNRGSYDDRLNNKKLFSDDKYIKSLQQTEWEVEIEMKTAWIGQCNCPCHSDGLTIMHIMACCHPKMVESPKLDSDGCLILKRK